jgi:archaellum biogenesis protein FlaJ (TadC family)
MYLFMPNAYRRKIESLIKFSGSRNTPSSFFSKTLFMSLVFAVMVGVIFRESFFYAFTAGFLISFALFHGFLLLAVEKRTKFVERVLPDALQLMAANIKSGFIPSRAMLLSARKEFGPLSDSIKRSGKEMLTGKSLEESITGITKDIKSDILDVTTKLIIRGIRSGGQLVLLFEETAIDIRRRESIKKDVKANILMYSIFIGFAACAGAPALYALSGYLVNTIGGLGSMVNLPEQYTSQVSLLQFGSVPVSPEFLFMFSVAAIVITTFFGGLIIGIIDSGKERSGIKYIPLMMFAALVVFFVARFVVADMFGTLILT